MAASSEDLSTLGKVLRRIKPGLVTLLIVLFAPFSLVYIWARRAYRHLTLKNPDGR